MIAIAEHGAAVTAGVREESFRDALLVALGGTLLGFGLSFPLRWPPHRMVFSLLGMFATQAWFAGNSIGLLLFAGLSLPLVAVNEFMRRAAERSKQN